MNDSNDKNNDDQKMYMQSQQQTTFNMWEFEKK